MPCWWPSPALALQPSISSTTAQFEVAFECIAPLDDDIEWRLVYVGSAESDQHDQLLDSVLVGPMQVCVYPFVPFLTRTTVSLARTLCRIYPSTTFSGGYPLSQPSRPALCCYPIIQAADPHAPTRAPPPSTLSPFHPSTITHDQQLCHAACAPLGRRLQDSVPSGCT